ncbi:MAG: hypothetical protein AB7L13_18075 [Acidimicrobiia bacterium]
MIHPTWATVRLFLHVLAATVWVGGQLSLAGLLPAVRSLGPDAPRVLARRFNRFAWPAYGVLWMTGVWNIAALDVTFPSALATTVMVKVLVVAVSGLAAFAHSVTRSKMALAAFGALSGLSALVALFLGTLIH